MKAICLYFQIHQPFRFRRYRFFDIGNDHYYYDDFSNETILRKIADNCYLPANEILLKKIKELKGDFKVTFSISGTALEQFELYAPEVIESFKALAATGHVEFLAETYSHSLVCFKNKEAFARQVETHSAKIEELFGQKPKVFRNTELIYSDEIGADVANMGFKGMLTEGAKHVLGWKSPNYMYCNAINPRLKVMMRNYKLSDDISFNFGNSDWSEYPLTPEKYAGWIGQFDSQEEIVNIFCDYESFGEHQKEETGIMDFLGGLPDAIMAEGACEFITPSEAMDRFQPVSAVHVPHPISWADEERDLSAWLGNDLQEEAYNKLYDLQERVEKSNDLALLKDWNYLQVSDHFYYMCTKYFSDGEVHQYFNPYDSPYDAFMNYMNVLNDFSKRLDLSVPLDETQKRLASLSSMIDEQSEELEDYRKEVVKLKAQLRGDKSKQSSSASSN